MAEPRKSETNPNDSISEQRKLYPYKPTLARCPRLRNLTRYGLQADQYDAATFCLVYSCIPNGPYQFNVQRCTVKLKRP